MWIFNLNKMIQIPNNSHRPLLSTAISIQMLLLCLLCSTNSALHIHLDQTNINNRHLTNQHSLSQYHLQSSSSQKAYNAQAYEQSLADIQVRYAQDIAKIKGQFIEINMKLKDTNVSSSDKVIYLQQTLAAERDQLYNIETYLGVPYALRSCQCLNLTQAQKDSLQAEINKTNSSIGALNNSLLAGSNSNNPKCPGGQCQVVKTVKLEIARMSAYASIMNDTITSECCRVVNYVYRDNLVDTNDWVYGNTTEELYRQGVFNKAQKNNLTQCPAARPFVNESSNNCLACPREQPLFDLGSRKCRSSCQSAGLVLIEKQHRCDVNRSCAQGKFFSNISFQCELNLGNASSCPQQRPIWNPQLLACEACPEESPFYDVPIGHCRNCTDNEVWYSDTRRCISRNDIPVWCPATQIYNFTLARCIPLDSTTPNTLPTPTPTPYPPQKQNGKGKGQEGKGEQTPNGGTYSQCPPSAPYWSRDDYACHQCPEQTPSFNTTTKQCEPCPPNLIYSLATQRCQSNSSPQQCGSNQKFNAATGRCEIVGSCSSDQVFNSATSRCEKSSASGQVGMCPPDRPNWNRLILACEKCNQTYPFFNPSSQLCQLCPSESKWDTVVGRCLSTRCPKGQQPGLQPDSCVPIQCSGVTPLFNQATGNCQECPAGTIFEANRGLCLVPSASRTNASACPQSAPYWSQLRLSCLQCPEGQRKNSNNQCQALTNHATSSLNSHGNSGANSNGVRNGGQNKESSGQGVSIQKDCGEAVPYWNEQKARCQQCPAGSSYNNTTKQCQECPAGSSYNNTTKECQFAVTI